MRLLFRLVGLVFSLGGWALAAASVYVIRTPEKITVLPRDKVEFRQIADVWADTRTWTLADAAAHPAMVKRLLERDKALLLAHLAPDADERELKRKLESAVEKGESETRKDQTLPEAIKGTVFNPKSRRSDAPLAKAGGADQSWLDLARSLDFD